MSLAGVYANKELTGEVAKSFAKTWRKIQAENLDGFKTDLISPLRVAIVPQGNPFTFTALTMTARVKLSTLRRSKSICCYQISVKKFLDGKLKVRFSLTDI